MFEVPPVSSFLEQYWIKLGMENGYCLRPGLIDNFFLQTFLIRNLLVVCMFVCLCEREKNRKTERGRERMCVCSWDCVWRPEAWWLSMDYFWKMVSPWDPGLPDQVVLAYQQVSGIHLFPQHLENKYFSWSFAFFKWPLQFKSRSPSLPGKHFMNWVISQTLRGT